MVAGGLTDAVWSMRISRTEDGGKAVYPGRPDMLRIAALPEGSLLSYRVVAASLLAGEGVLALPKLNLQFLTFTDYLLRNFNLFRLEATYEVREDIADVLQRVGPYLADDERVSILLLPGWLGGLVHGGGVKLAGAAVWFACWAC
jgi:hypothetical protein